MSNSGWVQVHNVDGTLYPNDPGWSIYATWPTAASELSIDSSGNVSYTIPSGGIYSGALSGSQHYGYKWKVVAGLTGGPWVDVIEKSQTGSYSKETGWSGKHQWSQGEYSCGATTLTGTSSGGKCTFYIGFVGTCTNCVGGDGETYQSDKIQTYLTYEITLNVTATFNLNGGTRTGGGATTQSVAYGGTPTAPTVARIGYTFTGWRPAIGAMYSNTTFTAQWRINTSTLVVKPNGGTWNSSKSDSSFKQNYNTTLLVPNPAGPVATFKENGGDSPIPSITASFNSWTKSNPFYGTLSGTTYTFGSYDNVTSTITAVYNSITLPSATRDGYVIAGWALSEHGPAVYSVGQIVDLTGRGDITLYAVWVTSPLWIYRKDSEGNLKWQHLLFSDTTFENVNLVRHYDAKSKTWVRDVKLYKYDKADSKWNQIIGDTTVEE